MCFTARVSLVLCHFTEKVKPFNWITVISTKIVSTTASLLLLLARHFELVLFPALKVSDLIIFIVAVVVPIRNIYSGHRKPLWTLINHEQLNSVLYFVLYIVLFNWGSVKPQCFPKYLIGFGKLWGLRKGSCSIVFFWQKENEDDQSNFFHISFYIRFFLYMVLCITC